MNLPAAISILCRDAIQPRDNDTEARLSRATAFAVVADALNYVAAAEQARAVAAAILADDEHQMRLFEMLESPEENGNGQ